MMAIRPIPLAIGWCCALPNGTDRTPLLADQGRSRRPLYSGSSGVSRLSQRKFLVTMPGIS
jgi:hypothetical protein